MKVSDFFPTFTAFKTKTDTRLDALEAANNKIADLSAQLLALEKEKKVKADEQSDTDSQDSELDSLISDLQAVLDKYTSEDSTDDSSDDSTTDDSTDDSTTDDSDDANDETAKAKASKVEKLKALNKQVAKVVADSKKLKADLPAKVIKELAAIGIPTPIATKPDNKPSGLQGRARVAAAFNEQFNTNK